MELELVLVGRQSPSQQLPALLRGKGLLDALAHVLLAHVLCIVQRQNADRSDMPSPWSVWQKWCGNEKHARCPCCFICVFARDASPRMWDRGHVQALSRRGSNALDNIVPLCTSCNNACGTDHLLAFALREYPQTFMLTLKFLRDGASPSTSLKKFAEVLHSSSDGQLSEVFRFVQSVDENEALRKAVRARQQQLKDESDSLERLL